MVRTVRSVEEVEVEAVRVAGGADWREGGEGGGALAPGAADYAERVVGGWGERGGAAVLEGCGMEDWSGGIGGRRWLLIRERVGG